ncbi:MAG: STAS domain-containing protein, partial [Bacteroidia bacterium]|nr:STAS domain-containing protein [Bacteroidia bacterium]
MCRTCSQSGVQTIDSTVLSALLLLRRLLEEQGRQLAVVAPSASVQSVFSLSKLDEIFTLMPTIEDALLYLKNQDVLLAKKAEE